MPEKQIMPKNKTPSTLWKPGDPANVEMGRKGGLASNESRKQDIRFLNVIKEQVSDSDLVQIIRKAVEQAKRGNRFAREFLWNYGVGKPLQMVEMADGQSPFMVLFAQMMQVNTGGAGEPDEPGSEDPAV